MPLAKRYRWRMRLVGVETEYKLALSTTEPTGVIAGVLPGQTVEIVVQAVNGSKQGVASAPVVFTVPAAAKVATPAKRAAAVEAASASANGAENGNGNGHPRVARVG